MANSDVASIFHNRDTNGSLIASTFTTYQVVDNWRSGRLSTFSRWMRNPDGRLGGMLRVLTLDYMSSFNRRIGRTFRMFSVCFLSSLVQLFIYSPDALSQSLYIIQVAYKVCAAEGVAIF